jgi:1,4-alpha-glucan branching enzyme
MVTVNGNRAEFSFFRPQAHSVHLIGDFNGWMDGSLSMTCNGGYWHAGIRLPAGDYKFRYVADGHHFVDYAAFGVEPGPFGFDSVVRIAAPNLKDAASISGKSMRHRIRNQRKATSERPLCPTYLKIA